MGARAPQLLATRPPTKQVLANKDASPFLVLLWSLWVMVVMVVVVVVIVVAVNWMHMNYFYHFCSISFSRNRLNIEFWPI